MKIFIHVGFPRTATTFLQTKIFPKLKNVNYFHTFSLYNKLEKDKINIISHELFSGKMYKNQRTTPEKSITNYKTITDRVKMLFPDAKIIITLRNYNNFYYSLYKHYIRHGGTNFYNDWFNNSNVTNYNFKNYIDYMKSNFKSVYVCDMDDLKTDSIGFVKGICDFIGVDMPIFDNTTVNKSLTDRELKIMRFLNRYVKSYTNRRFIKLYLRIFKRI